MSSIKMGTGDLAKYPFLNEAGDYIRQAGFNWDELSNPDMASVLDIAEERVEAGATGNVYEKLGRRFESEVLTFLVSLILVKSIGLEPVLRKFALAEARRAEKFLTEDLRHQSELQRRSLFSKIFDDLFKLKITVA
ncbi:MAG TPA: hypothetical protein VJP79_02640, partial [Nitrososphaera sp.]|nr:hypothetical protein [Nitrososphaera sp.]